MSTISSISTLKSVGILADRTSKCPPLHFRKYNLIYGFNGSGKTTLSRLFASLQLGKVDPKLPAGSSFSFSTSDNTTLASNKDLTGMEARILVFNSDFVEKNLQWTSGKANPVFFIGEDQADAAAELASLESSLPALKMQHATAAKTANDANNAFSRYKRDAAKLTAERLHLGSRKYEATHLQADYDKWFEEEGALDDASLLAAEDALRAGRAAQTLLELSYDPASLTRAANFIKAICEQKLHGGALNEVQEHPDMLLWIKVGHEYHESHGLKQCLYCESPIEDERRAKIATALNHRVDDFIEKIDKTASRLDIADASLDDLQKSLPLPDTVQPHLRLKYEEARNALVSIIVSSKTQLDRLSRVVSDLLRPPTYPISLRRLN